MDEKKKKISVRINGKEQQFEEKSSDEATKIPVIDLPDEDEGKERSNVIDFTKKRKEKRNVEPFWDDGNHENIPKIPPNNRKKKRKRVLKFSLKNLPVTLIVATISAIIVGISLGYTILTLMSTSNGSEISEEETKVDVLAENSGSSLIDMENYIVQGGAFSTMEKGKEMATIFQDRGQAGVLVSNTENYYLFIGIGHSKEDAEKISKLYTDNGFETYVKQHKVDGVVAQLDEEVIAFINEGVVLHQQLTEVTVGALTENMAIKKELVDQVMAWSSNDKIENVNEEAKEKITDYISHMKQAANYLEQYIKDSKEDILWLSQQKLLEAIVSYEQLLLALKS